MAEEKIGVSGEFDAEAFNRGLNKYVAALFEANKATTKAVAKFNALGASTNSLTSAGPVLQTFGRSVGTMTRSLTALGTVPINPALIHFLDALAASGSRIATVAPGMAQAGKSLTSFTRSLSVLGGLTLSAAPLTTFTNELFTALSRFGRFKTITNTVANLRSFTNSLRQISTLNLSAGNISQFANQFAPAMVTLANALRRMTGITQIPRPVLATLSSLGNIFRNFGAAPPNVGPFISALSRIATLMPKLAAIQAVPTKAIQAIQQLATGLGGLGNLANLNPAISALRRLVPILAQLALLKPKKGLRIRDNNTSRA